MKRLRLLSLALVAGIIFGCAGTIQTTQGPRPAAEVIAQDVIADALKALDDGYKAAVAIHDSTPICRERGGDLQVAPCDDRAKHAQDRLLLLKEAAALRSAWDLLIASKVATAAGDPTTVLKPLLASSDDFLVLAVRLKALTQEKADSIKRVLDAAKAFLGGN